mgnify:FL=1
MNMKLIFKHLFFCSLMGMGGFGLTACNDFLDREPITLITPDTYFTTTDHIANYVINYYNSYLVNTQGTVLFHQTTWNAGLAINDNNTDNYVRENASLQYFAKNWMVPTGQNLKEEYAKIRVWNYLIENVEPRMAQISGTEEDKKHYLGEGYFFRAMTYFNAMAKFGDLPIITEVLPNEESYLKEKSKRDPRNEVARFILKDLDRAISLLKEAGFKNNLRINKQTAQLFKSRVALYEATFEKYHRGSGRVPGDAGWPGKDMPYNQGKSFDIDGEIRFFLEEAMAAAKAVADQVPLTTNTHVMNPEYRQVYGWNPYFEMFSQPSLKNVPEVLLWKEYNKSLGTSHNAPYRTLVGDRSGITRSMVSSFLMKNGLPIYASGSGYKGDTSIDLEKSGRDERLQLFVWGESDVKLSDENSPAVKSEQKVVLFKLPQLTNAELQNRDLTGYRQRKHYTYDYTQLKSDELLGTNACPVFRAAEAYLNYIEACYEKNRSLDGDAIKYWKALRERAGVDTDLDKTIRNTNMAEEAKYDDLGVWSGDQMADATLYNIRRERRCEFMGEGMRWDDLIRWRSWDRLFTKKYIPQGINLWDAAYRNYENNENTNVKPIVANGSTESNCSSRDLGKYQQPFSLYQTNNQFYEGYSWMKAYYLYPIGVEELNLAEGLYQNPYWPRTGSLAEE